MRVAIIPARGGSRGVPGKNLMRIAGRSLLGHAIDCCSAADEVIVATDCGRIAELASICGATVHRLPPEIAETSSQDAMRHVLRGIAAEAVAFVQCTAPQLDEEDVAGCLDKLPGYDLTVCCVPFDGIVLDSKAFPINRPIGGSQRRQDHDRQYVISGGCWAFRPEYLNQTWMTGRIGIHPAKYPHRIEIDTPADVELAEAVLAHNLR